MSHIGSVFKYYYSKIIKHNFKNDIKSIGNKAFSGCENLKYIIVPNGNTSIRNLLPDHLRGKIIEKQHYDRAYKVVKDAFSQAIYDPL